MLTVILAGGMSRRMGRDKALLPFRGEKLCQLLIDRYSRLGSVAVSVNEAGRFAFKNARELVDPFPNSGPLNGLIAAFAQSGEDLAFITATDLPNGSPELAKRLAEMIGGHDACVLRRGAKGVEPLFGIYRRHAAEIAAKLMERGVKSFIELLRNIDVRYVDPEEVSEFNLEEIFININTPEEYECLLKSE